MERIDLTNIKNIIFDLGTVLLDLDFEQAKQKFKKLGLPNFDSFYTSFEAKSFFHDFETGKISELDFIKKLKNVLPHPVSDYLVQDAWETIIFDFPDEKINFLLQVSSGFNIFLLSNTNSIHAKKYEQQFEKKAGKSLHELFNKIYYSHEIGVRKPDLSAFSLILKENNLVPQETLFIDDIIQNLEPAKKLSMNTFLYKKNTDLFTIFNIKNNK